MPIPSQPKSFIPRPFAASGTYQNVPDTTTSLGRASYTQGFPVDTQMPITQGGLAPNRLDFNGMFNMVTSLLFWQQSGGQWAYNASLNYTVPSLVYHGGKLWWCVKENGPESANKAVAPGTNEAYWQEFIQHLVDNTEIKISADIPVGTVITYYGTTAPEGYFACNGGSFSATQYPQLRAVLGSTTLPDMRGYFVRGYDTRNTVDPDGQSRAVGSGQTDAIRNIVGKVEAAATNSSGYFEFFGDCGAKASGVFAVGDYRYQLGIQNTAPESYARAQSFTFDASTVVPVAEENRPKNVNLLYCIKHD